MLFFFFHFIEKYDYGYLKNVRNIISSNFVYVLFYANTNDWLEKVGEHFDASLESHWELKYSLKRIPIQSTSRFCVMPEQTDSKAETTSIVLA